MKLYICGPMSGLPGHNLEAFYAAEKTLCEAGYSVENPAWHGKRKWLPAMRADIKNLVDCDGVALLSGWHLSTGARLEHHIATELRMRIGSVNWWVNSANEFVMPGVIRGT